MNKWRRNGEKRRNHKKIKRKEASNDRRERIKKTQTQKEENKRGKRDEETKRMEGKNGRISRTGGRREKGKRLHTIETRKKKQ
jgi:hypothetical protein